MITDIDGIRGWITGRLPDSWQATGVEVGVDREEILVVVALPDAVSDSDASDAERAGARAGRAKAFREETRAQRMKIAGEAERRFGRTVSWGVCVGGPEGHRELFTHVAAPVMTRLRQPQRQVLDTLVESGVARSRADALAWCVRLVGQHEEDWLRDLREAMAGVADVRERGPAA